MILQKEKSWLEEQLTIIEKRLQGAQNSQMKM